MVRLSKEVLARQTKTEIYFPDGGETLGNLIERFGPQAFLNIEYDYSDCSIQIIWMRTETDEEYNLRIETTRQQKLAESERKRKIKAEKEAKERKLYKELKEKYG